MVLKKSFLVISMSKIDVGIVIIPWNMKDLLQTCLKSICSYIKDIFFEIIVILIIIQLSEPLKRSEKCF